MISYYRANRMAGLELSVGKFILFDVGYFPSIKRFWITFFFMDTALFELNLTLFGRTYYIAFIDRH